MSPILPASPRHTPAGTSSHNPDAGARPMPDIAPPSPWGGPSSLGGRHHVRGRRSERRRAATHLPHWKTHPWPRHGLSTHHAARRRDRDWMRLRRIKEHAFQGARRRNDEGLHRGPHHEGTASETAEEEDGKAPASLHHINQDLNEHDRFSLRETTNEGKGGITPLRPVDPFRVSKHIRIERDLHWSLS